MRKAGRAEDEKMGSWEGERVRKKKAEVGMRKWENGLRRWEGQKVGSWEGELEGWDAWRPGSWKAFN